MYTTQSTQNFVFFHREKFDMNFRQSDDTLKYFGNQDHPSYQLCN